MLVGEDADGPLAAMRVLRDVHGVGASRCEVCTSVICRHMETRSGGARGVLVQHSVCQIVCGFVGPFVLEVRSDIGPGISAK